MTNAKTAAIDSRMEPEEAELSEEELREQHLMADKLRQLREAKGLTRAELTAMLGEPFTEEMIAEYETGDVSMEATRVLRMTKALNASEESIHPKRLLAEHLMRTGYAMLSEERRKTVDLLAAALMEDQAKEAGNHAG